MTQWSSKKWLFAVILSIFVPNACSTTPESSVAGDSSYLDTAEKNYLEGKKAKDNKNYEQAVNYFEYVKNQFPYSKYAALADLAISDAYFESEQWLQAAESYSFFVQFHPKHEKVGWATFQIANAYTQAIPKNYPIMPKAHEKDQSTTQSAVVAWDRFLRKFPKHEKVTEAIKKRTEARSLLTDYKWAVAEFYESRAHFQGAAWRYEAIFKRYPDTPKAALAMGKAASLYENQLKEPEKAAALLKTLKETYPKSEAAKPVETKPQQD